ncbi:MAG: hypothetical protein DHS20C08_18330 [Rhodomicrobium sp.]|nr:MAG: hypothetical protein DHS20C08_18330 [Rhodomicrobium sp.]
MTNKMIISTRVLKTALTAVTLTALVASGTVMAGSLKSGTTLKPGNGMSFLVGNKRATTYFLPSSGACEVTVMVSEAKPMVELANYVPASRMRVKLSPGNVTKIDSFEGKTLRVMCNADAKSMTVQN